ncbi:Cytochrome P450 monooxygenase [Pseudocercospora fuligena]|uniref:Cytochrome P450 monooxygenase n=1 Tax=Pseudocercospora fuligena TaxID=685502 RepID=A0A8H6RCM1_9PEZI|nr:Cytochrome P450 monooxygenase [Pseudocercospora fuligena]
MAVVESLPGHGLVAWILTSSVIWKSATLVSVLALFVLLIDYARILVLHRQMPPGVIPLPIIGNTHLLPENKPWIYFEELSKKLKSPVITFWIGRNPTVWINDAWSASELLEKKAAVYASRPRMVVFAELTGMGQSSDPDAKVPGSNLVTMYYGDRWRVHRKITHAGVGLQQVRKYRDFQNDESKLVAFNLLSTPQEYVAHFERYAASVVSIIGFGRRIASITDPLITEVIAVMQKAADLNVPGKSFPMLFETFPWLASLPPQWFPWMFNGLGRRRRGQDFFYALADEARTKTPDEDCYVKTLFTEAPKYNLRKDEISSLAGNLFGAGSDTSSSTLITFVLACCAFPEVLPTAWEELDRVVGHHRSPSWEDEAELIYVKAFVKEVFRWRSVAIIGGQPHAPIHDDEWNGYKIPKGTWTQGNVWAIHHNESEFPEPDRFNPDRFLKDNAVSRPFPNEKGYMTFGWGRRVCSGQGLAEQGTFITVARLLWAFRIEKARDSHGHEIPVDIFNYTNGLNMRPQEFPCSFVPRSEDIRLAVEREGRQALDDLARYDGESERVSEFFKKAKQVA